MLSSSESRRRRKDTDRDRSSPKSKDRDREERRERHKSSKSSRSSRSKTGSSISKDDDLEHERPREERPLKERVRTSSSTSQTPKAQHRMAIVPEMERRASLGLGSLNGSKTSLSTYPTLSKVHAKENIYAREEGVERRKSPFTPEPTDVGDAGETKDTHGKNNVPIPPARAPPSPPLTATTGVDLRKTASANSMRRKNSESVHKEMEAGRRSVDSGTRLTPEPRFGASRSSLREGGIEQEGTDLTSTMGRSEPSTVKHHEKSQRPAGGKVRSANSPHTRTPDRPSRLSPAVRGRQSSTARPESEITQSTDSDATSVAQDHGRTRRQQPASPINAPASPASLVDSSPLTPTPSSVLPSVLSAQKTRPPTVEIFTDPASRSTSVDPSYFQTTLPPPPPPPPPMNMEVPRVDYLLKNGGLPYIVPRNILFAEDEEFVPSYSQYASPRPEENLAYNAQSFFRPLQDVINSYNAVLDKNGSMAVATGYRSVARRLLDRLEHVFNRNISGEFCACLMCMEQPVTPVTPVIPGSRESAGVNWGEILELVSGRRDLPTWPPVVQESSDGLGITDLADPCQRIDMDVPEEYHDHFVRQSQKTKAAVQSWLSSHQETAPEEADDDTLTFAMLTRVEQDKRSLFHALLCGLHELPSGRTPLAQPHGSPPVIIKAALALQRLYRLSAKPRDQLVVVYLIQNPAMHDILATLAAVTKHEWDILISGRFDGFLWSGAESLTTVASPSPSRAPSTSTPSPHPGSTAPVAVDEDTEIAILAEVEREIHAAMDALENAFEHLHVQAEVVRDRLRNRSAALLMAAQARRGATGVEVRIDTPASFAGPDVDGENLMDLRSDIGPDDSASNVSHRRRRAHRHRHRQTPAPIEE